MSYEKVVWRNTAQNTLENGFSLTRVFLCLYTGKYWSEETRILAYFKLLIFHTIYRKRPILECFWQPVEAFFEQNPQKRNSLIPSFLSFLRVLFLGYNLLQFRDFLKSYKNLNFKLFGNGWISCEQVCPKKSGLALLAVIENATKISRKYQNFMRMVALKTHMDSN